MAFKKLTAALLTTALCLSACGERSSEPEAEPQDTESAAKVATLAPTPSPDGARVFFISPADGETLSNPVKVVFGIKGMDVVPAGTHAPDSGHHHLLIDSDLPDFGLPIPKDSNHIHFGDGSTETEITLKPGPHRLQMLLGDHLHIPHDPPLISDSITIHVE